MVVVQIFSVRSNCLAGCEPIDWLMELDFFSIHEFVVLMFVASSKGPGIFIM